MRGNGIDETVGADGFGRIDQRIYPKLDIRIADDQRFDVEIVSAQAFQAE